MDSGEEGVNSRRFHDGGAQKLKRAQARNWSSAIPGSTWKAGALEVGFLFSGDFDAVKGSFTGCTLPIFGIGKCCTVSGHGCAAVGKCGVNRLQV